MTFRTYVIAAAILLALAAAAGLMHSKNAPPAVPAGDRAPQLNVAEWVQGGPISLAEGRGKNVYLIEFWATWCVSCRGTYTHLNELQNRFGGRGLVVLGVTSEPPETVRAFLKGPGIKIDYAVAADREKATYDAYMKARGINGYPTAFVVNRDGLIVWHGHPLDTQNPAGSLADVLEKALR